MGLIIPQINLKCDEKVMEKRGPIMAKTVERKGSKLCIEIDLEKSAPSASDKV